MKKSFASGTCITVILIFGMGLWERTVSAQPALFTKWTCYNVDNDGYNDTKIVAINMFENIVGQMSASATGGTVLSFVDMKQKFPGNPYRDFPKFPEQYSQSDFIPFHELSGGILGENTNSVELEALNDIGELVGFYTEKGSSEKHGFAYYSSDNDPPQSRLTDFGSLVLRGVQGNLYTDHGGSKWGNELDSDAVGYDYAQQLPKYVSHLHSLQNRSGHSFTQEILDLPKPPIPLALSDLYPMALSTADVYAYKYYQYGMAGNSKAGIWYLKEGVGASDSSPGIYEYKVFTKGAEFDWGNYRDVHAAAINYQRDIAGNYIGKNAAGEKSTHGFVIYETGVENSKWVSFDCNPVNSSDKVISTSIRTINDWDVLGGTYMDSSGANHGFVAVPVFSQ